MTTANLVTIDFDSEIANNNNEIDENSAKNCQEIEIDLTPELGSYSDSSILEDIDTINNESQPLLGGDHTDHSITYNQFPGEHKEIFTFPRIFSIPSSM